jgi:hypothetical protein
LVKPSPTVNERAGTTDDEHPSTTVRHARMRRVKIAHKKGKYMQGIYMI